MHVTIHRTIYLTINNTRTIQRGVNNNNYPMARTYREMQHQPRYTYTTSKKHVIERICEKNYGIIFNHYVPEAHLM